MDQRTEIVFVDESLQDFSTLLTMLPQGTEIIRLNSQSDGVEQIAKTLEGRSGIDAIHVLSHGSAGELQLGTTQLNAASLNDHATQLATIGQSLKAGGDLLLYGCNVAQGVTGQSFIESVARITHADVAASTNLTGAAGKGGDWVLETNIGSVETQALSVSGFNGLLGGSYSTVTTNAGYATNLLLDASGNLYSVDSSFSMVYKTSTNQTVTTLLTRDDIDPWYDYNSCSITDIAKDNSYIYVSYSAVTSSFENKFFIARINPATGLYVDSLDIGTVCAFGMTNGLDGNIYVSDVNNNQILKFSNGTLSLVKTLDFAPKFLAADSGGNIYIIQIGGVAIKKLASDGTITTIADQNGVASGVAHISHMQAQDIAVDSSGNVYITDSTDNSTDYKVIKIAADGSYTVIANQTGVGGAVDMPDAFRPCGIAVDTNGNIYVGDYGDINNPGSAIEKITVAAPNTAPTISSVPGSGSPETITTGAYAYPAFTFADADGDTLDLTLTATNGTINGIADFDFTTPGIQQSGTATELNALIADGSFTSNADGSSTIVISVTDNHSAPVTATYYMTSVAPPPEAPEITGLNGDNVTTTTGVAINIDALPQMDAVATVTDGDSSDFDGGYVLIAGMSGTADGNFSTDTNLVRFGATEDVVNGTPAMEDNVFVFTVWGWRQIGVVDLGQVGPLDGQGGHDLRIDLNSDATPDYTSLILQGLKYSSNTEGTRVFNATVNDGNGGTSSEAFFSVEVTAPASPAPSITNLNNDSQTYTGFNYLDAGQNATVSDAQFDAINAPFGDWTGATLTVQRKDGAITTDLLNCGSDGVTVQINDVDQTLRDSPDQIFAHYTAANGVLTVTFDGTQTDPTNELVQHIVQNISYEIGSGTLAGDAIFDIVLSDGTDSVTATSTIKSNKIYVTNNTDTAVIDRTNGISFHEAIAIAAAQTSAQTEEVILQSGVTSPLTISGTTTLSENIIINADFSNGETLTGGTFDTNGQTLTIYNGSNDTYSVSSVVSGTGNLAKTGAGTVTLSGTNTYSGTTSVTGGKLTATNNNSLGTSAATLDGGTLNFGETGALNLANAITLGAGGGTLQSAANWNDTLSGTISGGNLTVTTSDMGSGSHGILILSGNNSYTGTTTLNLASSNGVLRVAGDTNLGVGAIIFTSGRLSITGDTVIDNTIQASGSNAYFSVSTGKTAELTGVISGSNGVTVDSGTLKLNAANTYTSSTYVYGSSTTLIAATDASLPDATQLELGSGALTLLSNQTVGALNPFATPGSASVINLGSYNVTLGTNANSKFAGAINGSGNIVKNGNGTFTVTSSSAVAASGDYSGTTTVNAGVLQLDGTMKGAISIASGAKLSGGGINTTEGDALGAVSIASGGTLTPGASAGLGTADLKTGNLTIASGGTLAMNLSGSTAGYNTNGNDGYDQIITTGTVNISGATLTVTSNISPTVGNSFTLIDNDGVDAVTGTFNGLAEGAIVTVNGTEMTVSYVGGTGNDIILTAAGDTTAPTVSVTAAKLSYGLVTSLTTAQSSEEGTVYLVSTDVTVTDLASLEAAVNGTGLNHLANKSTVTTPNSTVSIDISDLAVGTYKVYSVDAAGNVSAASANTVSIGIPSYTNIAGVSFSADTGFLPNDLYTNTAAQTISGTLGAATVAGEIVEVSLDNGANWTTATNIIGQNSWSLSGQTLAGDNTLLARVVKDGFAGVSYSRSYWFDTTIPTSTVDSEIVAVGGTVQTAQSSEAGAVVLVNTSAPITDFTSLLAAFNAGTAASAQVSTPNSDTQISTTGLPAGTYKVYSVDYAGNVSAASANTITLATPPTTTNLSVAFSADTGISSNDFITKMASQNLSGTLSAVTVAGETVEVSLDNGTTWTTATNVIGETGWTLAGQTLTASSTLQVRVTNAGISGTASSQAYLLDTTAPVSSVTTANVTIGTNVTTAQSTETGIVYLVKTTDTPADYAALENLVTGGAATKATVIAGGSNTVISTSGLAAGSYKIYSVDAAGNVSNVSDNTITLVVNNAPTLGSIPGSTQQVTTAVLAALPDFTVADTDGGTLTVTLTAANGTIGGLTDADPATPGIQLTGTAAQINTALANALFTATAAGAASIGFSLSDGVAAAVTATYSLNATTPVVPPVDPSVDPPVTPPVVNPPTDDDNDGITATTENQVPTLPPVGGGTTVVGDGNGDGVADNQQASVTSVPFLKTTTAVSNPTGAPPVYVTLVADSNAGVTDTTDTNSAQLTSVQQKDAPTGLPSEMLMPLGLISFVANVGTAGITETFSLFVDSSVSFNGYWKQDKAGTWCNIATAIETVGGKTRIDFAITDGGAFDADGKADGIITDPGAIGSMPLSLVGELPVTTGTGFWF